MGQARLAGRTLVLGRRQVPLYSGAFHYWRHDVEDWPRALAELANLGLPIVETYVPWGVHEDAKGEFDFGEHDPRHDLGHFLDLCKQAGLWVFLRPGPHINAELTYFGLPERIIYDQACQARSSRHNPVILPFPPRMFPVPSYASSRFHAEVGKWYDAVARIVSGHLFPDGPVVLLQVDNEAAFYFRNGPYDQDYHPDALALYRRYLEGRHGTLEALAHAYGVPYKSWDDVLPPERFAATTPAELPPHLEWAEFHEYLLNHALGRMRRRMSKSGLRGVPVVHNVALGDGGMPISVPGMDRVVDLVGFDYYHQAREHRTIKRRTLYLAGTVALPYAPEMGAGAPAWFTPLSQRDSLFCAMAACAYGLRGMNLYMAVDRDRWYGAPIDHHGNPRIEAGSYKHLFGKLAEYGFHDLTRRADVALIVPAEYRRLSRATHLLGGMASPSALEAIGGTPVDGCSEDYLGFKGPVQILWWRMLAKTADALTRLGIPYVYIDSEADPARLAGYRVLVRPTYEFASPDTWARVAEHGREAATVVYGPAMPSLAVNMRPHPFEVPRHGHRVLFDEPDDAPVFFAKLADELDLHRPFSVEPFPVETAVHGDSHGPRIVFVINPQKAATAARISLPGPTALRDCMNDETYSGERTIDIEIPGFTCRMLAIEGLLMSEEMTTRETRPRARAKRGSA